MEAPGPPPPCVHLVGPALPAPPSVAPTPLPAEHEGTVICAGSVRSGAVVLPHSHFVDGGGSKVSASVPKKTRAMKKAGAVQPPRAPARSAAAPSTQASAQEATDVVAMDDAQQLLEKSPARVAQFLFGLSKISKVRDYPRSGIIQDMNGREIVENPKLDATLRYKNLCKTFTPLASRAADFEDYYLLLEETLHTASKQIEEKIRGTSNINAENSNVQETFSLPEQYTQVASLKKKEKKEGVSKQKKSWTEKFKKKKKNKGKKKNPSNPVQQEDGIHVPESQAYESISSFIQILMSSNPVQDVSNSYSLEGIDGWEF